MLHALKISPLARTVASMPRARRGPIGLDLGPERLQLVQMDVLGGAPRMRAMASLPYPDGRDAVLGSPARLRALLRAAMRGRSFTGRRVVTCMPPEQVRLWPESYRVTHDQSEGATVLALALERVGGSAADWVVDFIPVRRESAETAPRDAIVTCARREHVLAQLNLLAGAGLEVDAVEVGPVAVQRLMAAVSATTAEQNLLTINVGHARSFFTVFAGRRLMVERDAALGEQVLIARVARELELAPQEARELVYRYGFGDAAGHGDGTREQEISHVLAAILKPCLLELVEDVEKIVVYTASKLRGAAVDRVYLLGSLARWPGAAETLSRLLALPAEVMDPLAAFAAPPEVIAALDAEGATGLALATGCALRGIVEGV